MLRFFWIEPGVLPGGLIEIDRAFAQGLLVESIDSSYHMGYVEHLFSSFYMQVPTSFGDIKDMLKEYGNLGGHLKTDQLSTGQNRPVGEPPQARVFYRNRM